MEMQEGGQGEGFGGYPYCSALTSSQLTVAAPNYGPATYYFSWQIIEHKSQTIYPVIVSIAATTVNIDWAKEPSVAAEVSLLVIEYI